MNSLITLFFCFFLSACPFFHKDPVVLQINEKQWTATVFADRLAQKIHSFNIENVSNPLFMESLKKQLVSDLLMEYLVQKRAKAYSLWVSEKEWKQTLQKIQSSYSSKEVFDLYLRRQKTNIKTWEQSVQRTLLHEKVVRHIVSTVKKPSDKELRDYYQSHLSLWTKKAEVFIYHIYHQKKEPVLQARKHLEKKSFTPPSIQKTQLANLGLQVQKQWVEQGSFALFDKAFALKKNAISPIWSSSYGYHIIQVLDKKPARVLTYKEALPRIQKLLMDQRRRALFASWLDTESQKVEVWTDPVVLKQIKVKIH